MKKLTILLIATIIIAGAAFAQPVRDQRREAAPQAERQREANPQMHRQAEVRPQHQNDNRRAVNPERIREAVPITINGTLKLERGIVAIQGQDDTVYLAPMLNRFIGFITGLREGANITVEGYQIRTIINPIKATIDGQTYDFRRLIQNNININNDRRDNPRNKENFRHNRNNHNQSKHNSCNCCR